MKRKYQEERSRAFLLYYYFLLLCQHSFIGLYQLTNAPCRFPSPPSCFFFISAPPCTITSPLLLLQLSLKTAVSVTSVIPDVLSCPSLCIPLICSYIFLISQRVAVCGISSSSRFFLPLLLFFLFPFPDVFLPLQPSVTC